ncbi:class I SAM-dependent methyltransferase [bacterium]|nr:class I SAM-dependent methyltransferase [bacterium]
MILNRKNHTGNTIKHASNDWYDACSKAASIIHDTIPAPYRNRTFPGIIGDIKALAPRKALSLISRKKGLGKQYAYLYLTQGVDHGRGYQACAAEALKTLLGETVNDILRGNTLDVGCAVGVTAGILGLDGVSGFDLFPDLLKTAGLVDSFTGRHNRYITADMTRDWPFESVFDTVVCGLVCHHLKEQSDIVRFFNSLNRVLHPGGRAVITLPAGSVGTVRQFDAIVRSLENFGLAPDRERSGLVHSADNPSSFFWMFVIVARKNKESAGSVFIGPNFGFHHYRTPETREEKGIKARSTAASQRRIKHERFELVAIDDMDTLYGDNPLVYETLASD